MYFTIMQGHHTPLLVFLNGVPYYAYGVDRSGTAFFFPWYGLNGSECDLYWYWQSFAELGKWQVQHGGHTSLPCGFAIFGLSSSDWFVRLFQFCWSCNVDLFGVRKYQRRYLIRSLSHFVLATSC